MKAISLRQPYAGLVIAGIKKVENRTWQPSKSLGTIAIVSTAKPDAQKWWGHMRTRCKALGVAFPEALCKINGAILGTVTFDYVVWQDGNQINTDHPTIDQDALNPWWNPDNIGFIFSNPRRLATPIPVKGQLGFYNLPEEVEAQITKQMEL